MNQNNWFVVRLLQQNKLLFCFVLFFSFFQIFFEYKRIHSFPWIIWDMYSRVETIPDTIIETEIFIDGKILDVTKIPIWQEATILHTYKMYNWQKLNEDHDPMNEVVRHRTSYFPKRIYHYVAYKINNHKEETEKYPVWLLNYLEKISHKKIKNVALKDVQYKYQNGKFRSINSFWTVLKIEN